MLGTISELSCHLQVLYVLVKKQNNSQQKDQYLDSVFNQWNICVVFIFFYEEDTLVPGWVLVP